MPLIVPLPPAHTARLRFTTGNGILSRLIQQVTQSPEITHVEAVIADGTIITALVGEPVARHPNNYNIASVSQIFIDIPMKPGQYTLWCNSLYDACGKSFDLEAMIGEALGTNLLHQNGAFFCSELQLHALVDCHFFEPYESYKATPIDLYRFLFTDKRAIKHPIERLPQ